MRIAPPIKLTALGLILLLVTVACSDGIESTSERVSDYFVESKSERLLERADDTLARLDGAASDLSVFASETVTLRELQAAGIPVGSREIDCDEPLDIVVVEGMFDRENLFSSGVSMAGGSFEAIALDMVAEIYDPETDMPLGMIGDETGGSLSGITQSSEGSVATSGIDGGMMLTSVSADNGDGDKLIPEAVCAE